MGEWYYIGHYGQLGPLTREQVDELIAGGVIARDTYVWKNGMTDWVFAEKCPDLTSFFAKADPYGTPPPRPTAVATESPRPMMASATPYDYSLRQPNAFYPVFGRIRSDRSRMAAGILQLFLPGVGRMYLGFFAYGVIQLVLTLTCGVGWIWSVVDGIIILTGGVRLDGYGRELSD